jgi:hypothetical protein
MSWFVTWRGYVYELSVIRETDAMLYVEREAASGYKSRLSKKRDPVFTTRLEALEAALDYWQRAVNRRRAGLEEAEKWLAHTKNEITSS